MLGEAPDGTNTDGFQVTIGGINANASTVGDGEDIVAVVSVGGGVVHSGSLKLADVTTGLIVKVAAADVLQCETDTETETAVITIQEGAGFAGAINDGHSFVVTFTGIPDGVTVMVPRMEPKLTATGGVTAETAAASFGVTLREGGTSGVTVESGSDMGTVILSVAGMGEVVYEVDEAFQADDT